MEKVDLKKIHKISYTAKAQPKIVEVPPINYIAFDGMGDPGNSQDFQDAMGVLYGLAYNIKFMCKEREKDFTVMPLEGLWWADDPDDFKNNNRENWKWTVMIAVPDFVDQLTFDEGKKRLCEKKDVPQIEKGYLKTFEDGLAAQILHMGAYSNEAENIQILHDFVKSQGYKLIKKHREIYISSPRRTAEEKLKTIIRHSIEKV